MAVEKGKLASPVPWRRRSENQRVSPNVLFAIETGVGDPQAEAFLDFKFYRRATDKIIGLSDAAGSFLPSFF